MSAVIEYIGGVSMKSFVLALSMALTITFVIAPPADASAACGCYATFKKCMKSKGTNKAQCDSKFDKCQGKCTDKAACKKDCRTAKKEAKSVCKHIKNWETACAKKDKKCKADRAKDHKTCMKAAKKNCVKQCKP